MRNHSPLYLFETTTMKTLLILILLCSCLSAADLSEARALMKARKPTEAKLLLEKVVQLEPKNVDALYYLGMSLRQLGDEDAALDKLQLAADLAPKRIEVLAEYGVLAGELSRKRRSMSLASKFRGTMDQILLLDPHHLVARESLISYYSGAPWFAGGSMKKAFAHAKLLSEQDAARGLFWQVQLNLKEKDYDKAFEACETALKDSHNDSFVLYQFGRCAAESGQRLAEGRTALESCLKTSGPYGNAGRDQAFLHLGRIARKQGDAKAATAYFEQGLKENPRNSALQKELGVSAGA